MTNEFGSRFDKGKPRYDLIPPAALKALAEHYAAGAKKYDDRNWEKGLSWNTCYRALLSHATEWYLGHDKDIDPAMAPYEAHHLIAVVWNAIALFEYQRRDIGVDDRPKAQFELSLEDAESSRVETPEFITQVASSLQRGSQP